MLDTEVQNNVDKRERGRERGLVKVINQEGKKKRASET